MQRTQCRSFALGLSLALALSANAHSADVTGIFGLEYSQGDYGTNTTTRQWAAPFGVKYDTNFGYAKASSALISVNNVNPNAMGEALPCGNSTSANRDVQGLGDTNLSLMKHVHSDRSFQLDLGTKIKFATGDVNKCLSTGKNDFSLQADAFKQLDAYGLFGTLGLTYKGKPEIAGQTINYRNPMYFSIGASRSMDNRGVVGISYDYRDALLDGRSSLQELTIFGVHRVSPNFRIQPYLMRGFTSSSPSVGIGINALNTF